MAGSLNIPVVSPDNLLTAKDELLAFGAEAAALVAYGKLVPQAIIDIFPKGIINIHPSLLPKHRGSIPIESVILHGELTTGVSLMALTAEMDAGPVYAQEKVALVGSESKKELTTSLRDRAKDLLLENLPAILDGSLEPTPQDDLQATYDERIDKKDGIIDWQKPAVQLEREVRAYLEWPRSRTKLGSFDVIITAARVEQKTGPVGSLYKENKQLLVLQQS